MSVDSEGMKTRETLDVPAAVGGNGRDAVTSDDNPWSAEERKLQETLEDATASATRNVEEWSRSVEDVFGDWSSLLTDLAARHRKLADKLVSSRPEGPSLPREVIGEYRRAVTRDILQPLLDIHSRNRPPIDISVRFRQLLEAMSKLPERFPENVRLLEPRGLYVRKTDDPAGVKLRKRLHSIRLTGAEVTYRTRSLMDWLRRREPRRRLPASRVVPARHLAVYHLRQQLPDRLVQEHTAAQRTLAALVEYLERVVRAWANGVLIIAREAEPDTHTSGEHIPWDIAPEPPRPPEARQSPADTDDGGSRTTGPAIEEVPAAGASEEGEPAASSETPSLFEQLRERAAELQVGLEQVLAKAEVPPSTSDEILEGVLGRLGKDLAEGGTLLLPLSRRPLAADAQAGLEIRRAETSWVEWYGQVDQRIRYYLHLMKLREKMLALERTLVQRVGEATVKPVLSTFADMSDRLQDTRDTVEGHADKARPKKDPILLAERLEKAAEEAVGFVQQVFSHLPGLVSSDEVLSDPGRAEWDELCRFVQSLPEKVSMHSLPSDHSAAENPRVVELEVRDLIADVLEPPLPDRLRRPAEQLRSAVRRVWTETEQIQSIVQYNFDAAIDELTAEKDSEDAPLGDDSVEAEPPPGPVELIDSATKLVVDGIGRASMTLSNLSATLQPSWASFIESINDEFRQDWVDVHRRLHTADTAEEQWAGLRSQLGRRLKKAREQARDRWQKIWAVVIRVVTLGRRRAESLIRIGQTAVGVLDTKDVTRYQTIDALTAVEKVQAELPLIYRRLFSFEPLDETSLLEGRARDLVWVKQHFSRWENAHQLGVLLVQAPLGSGRTSFLNALEETTFGEYDARVVNLRERMYHPDEFAALIGPELDIEKPDLTLDELEDILVHTKRSKPPRVCLLDNLEHLVLRAAQGGSTIERIILFMSRTDRSLYWVGTVGTHTWQFLSKTAGTAVGFVDSYPLTPLDRSTLESLIINRHRRSGMTLTFGEPEDASAILRQRLKRAKTDEQRQALAREEYFDRLWRGSGQNVMLALFQWIRSARFSEDQSTLHVQPLKALQFDYLNDLPLEQAFTLKGFFLHKTLSLSDHSRIFNMSDAESTAILESLLNSFIIEEVPVSERRVSEDYHVKRDAVYRLRPLLIHPVTGFLQSKNIVY